MKKVFMMILGVCLFAGVAMAGEMEEKQLQLRSIQWEYQFCKQRMLVLQTQATELKKQIDKLKLAERTKKAAELKKAQDAKKKADELKKVQDYKKEAK